MAVGADKFACPGRPPLRGMSVRLIGNRSRPWRPWTANGGRRGQVSAFGTKTAQRGVYSAHKGRCGSCRPPQASFHVRTESRLEGHLFGPQRQMRSNGVTDGFSRSARTSFHVQNENRSEGRLFGSRGQMRFKCSNRQGHVAILACRPEASSSGAPPPPW